MTNYYHKDHIGVYENFVPKEFCVEVINFFEKQFLDGKFNSRNINSTFKQDLSTGGMHTIYANNFFKNMIPLLDLYFKKYGIVYEMFTFSDLIPLFSDFKIQKTNPTEGYHLWHCENQGAKEYDRFLVWTLYLNDVVEGGETEFLYQSLRIKPTTGTVCIFPAYFTHTHRGNPPLSGVKYIATGWFTHDYKRYIESKNISPDAFVTPHDNDIEIPPFINKYYNE
jgi:hypothetical protein